MLKPESAKIFQWAILGVVTLLGSSCSVGPDYHPPAPVALPTDWRWKKAEPQDAAIKGSWWELFGDPELNRLEAQARQQNQDLRGAVARVDRARASARLQGAAFYPNLSLDPAISRTQLPTDNPQFSIVPIPGIEQRFRPYNSFSVPLDLSYEIDLWGRVRRSFEGAQAQAQASVADYVNVLLTLTSDVAVEYLTLREYDSEVTILSETLKTRREALRINEVRLRAGRATEVDVSEAKTDLTNADAALASVEQDRAKTQNALAVLCGVNATDLNLPALPLHLSPPSIPVGLPTSLLERRPDVAEAERTIAAKNASIGVAYAAWFPSLSLTGQGGVLSAHSSDLFNWSNTIWTIGPSVRLPIFDGGQNLANLQAARADYNEAVAAYRATVLRAVKDVEDALVDLHFLARQDRDLQASVTTARQTLELEKKRFLVGQINYTDVIVADATRLSTERQQAQVRGQQLYATVRLIKALGGGWNGTATLTDAPLAVSASDPIR